jgi:TonB family protein
MTTVTAPRAQRIPILRARTSLVVALALALLAAERAPLEGGTRKVPGDPESTSAREFVHQLARPGNRIDGRVPALFVNASDSDRVVAVGWKKRPENVHDTARAIADYGKDSCLVEWIAPDGAMVKETWWLDRDQGLMVSRDPRGWFLRTYNASDWGFVCRALGVPPGPAMFNPRAADYAVEGMLQAEMESYARWKAAPPDSQPNDGDSVFVEALPEALERVAPEYPSRARDLGETGVVIVKALVGTDGNVEHAFPVESVPDLDGASVTCVEQWRFKPAMSHGRAIAVWIAIPVKFSLN